MQANRIFMIQSAKIGGIPIFSKIAPAQFCTEFCNSSNKGSFDTAGNWRLQRQLTAFSCLLIFRRCNKQLQSAQESRRKEEGRKTEHRKADRVQPVRH